MGFGSYDEEDRREETVEANDDDQLDRPDDADAEGDLTFENGSVEEQLARFREARGETAADDDGDRAPDGDDRGGADGSSGADGLVDEVAGRLSDDETPGRGGSGVEEPERDDGDREGSEGVTADDARRPGDDDATARLRAHLREATEDETLYVKSKHLADEVGLSAKQIGSRMPGLTPDDPEAGDLVVEEWGYTSGTTWKVTRAEGEERGADDPFAAAADLDGVGETVVGRLRDRFDAGEFAAATAAELTDVTGLGRTKAERIAAETGAASEAEDADRGR
jgi:hypothetical protein